MSPGFKISGIGYQCGGSKRASLVGPVVEARWSLEPAGGGASQADGGLLGPFTDPDDGAELWVADFSGFDEPGSYRLAVPGLGSSAEFPIGPGVYTRALAAAMLGFYGLRCGCGVDFEFDGQRFMHGPCHLGDGCLDLLGRPGRARDATRGWHDAGDYNKYTVNGAVSLGLLLKAWEDFEPGLAGLDLGFLPEHGGPLPDYLAELRWGLDWLLAMQLEDGSASHKLSALRFNGFELPDAERAPRYFSPPSSQATAGLCAVAAQAARVFGPLDASFAGRCAAAAGAAWAWLEAHPGHRPADLSAFRTGAYDAGPAQEGGFRLWAQAQWCRTQDRPAEWPALEASIRGLGLVCDPDWDWSNPRLLGILAYLQGPDAYADPALRKALEARVLEAAWRRVEGSRCSGYGRTLQGSYYWGSNGSLARAAVLLEAAQRLDPRPDWGAVAMDQLSFLFGRNPYGRSQVTGLGVDPPLDPHHRPSGGDAIAAPWPGLLVGGGQSATNWRDERASYQTNEVAINWQASLVYNLALFSGSHMMERCLKKLESGPKTL